MLRQILCRTCTEREGAEHYCVRVTTVFESGGKPLPQPKDRCSHCVDRPTEVSGKVPVPADQKLWLMADVNPQEYETRGEQKVMKDWAQGEFDARVGAKDADEVSREERAREKKRRQAQEARLLRRGDITPAEIQRIDSAVRRGILKSDAQASGLVIP